MAPAGGRKRPLPGGEGDSGGGGRAKRAKGGSGGRLKAPGYTPSPVVSVVVVVVESKSWALPSPLVEKSTQCSSGAAGGGRAKRVGTPTATAGGGVQLASFHFDLYPPVGQMVVAGMAGTRELAAPFAGNGTQRRLQSQMRMVPAGGGGGNGGGLGVLALRSALGGGRAKSSRISP